jgi:hypothetical protein
MPAERVTPETQFAAGLLDPARPVPSHVKGRAPRRYAVYRNNVTVGLVRAMETNFPAVRRLLGEAYFGGLARSFVQAHPPASPLLFRYGEGFDAFLEQQPDLRAYPYLADVARLEQLCRRAYHAADATPLAPDVLASLAADELMACRFKPHPAMALLSSPFAVHAIFTANRGQGGAVAEPFQVECALVTRPKLDVMVTKVSPATHGFLAALADGRTLAESADAAFASDEGFDLAAAIRLMVEAGAFRNVMSGNQS